MFSFSTISLLPHPRLRRRSAIVTASDEVLQEHPHASDRFDGVEFGHRFVVVAGALAGSFARANVEAAIKEMESAGTVFFVDDSLTDECEVSVGKN